MRRIPVRLYSLLAGGVVLGVVFVSVVWAFVGDDDQAPRTQAPSESLELRPRFVHAGPMDPWVVVEAEVVGDTFVRYAVEVGSLRFIGGFLDRYRFGEKGRPMVVHALVRQRCVAWTAGYDGLQKMWVRARPPLTGLGPNFHDADALVRWDAGGRVEPLSAVKGQLPPAAAAVDPQPCFSPAVLAEARVAAGLR